MNENWTLAEGIEKLFTLTDDDEPEIDDLSTSAHRLVLDVSFAVTDEIDEIDGVKIDPPEKGISVILTADHPFYEEDEDHWLFSRTIFPREGETLPELIKRIAIGLGVKPDERIWEDGQG